MNLLLIEYIVIFSINKEAKLKSVQSVKYAHVNGACYNDEQ